MKDSVIKETILVLPIVLSLTIFTVAQTAGDLDPTFGTGGKIVDGTLNGPAHAIAIQPDGKLVILGEWAGSTWDVRVGLARFNPDGSLDTTFGTGGKVEHPYWFNLNSVAIQPDGKIVVAGLTPAGESSTNFVVGRFNSDGTVDSAFGDNGYAYPYISGTNFSAAYAVAMQSSGNIVVTGDTDLGFMLAGIRADGSVSFLESTPVSRNARAISIAIQPDGKIVAAGGFPYFTVVRYNANGSPDTTFGNNGVVTTYEVGGIAAVAVQADGKIVTSGSLCAGAKGCDHGIFAQMRYNSDGSLDARFGSEGKVYTTIGDSAFASSLAIQPDGKFVVAGTFYHQNSQTSHFCSVRYDPNGLLDSTFGNGGVATYDFGSLREFASGMALDPEGRAVVVGESGGSMAIARFLLGPGAVAPGGAPFDFDGDGRSDISVFRPSDSVWYLNRSTQGFSATQFGVPTDTVVPADYDGDGKTDVAVYRDGTWWRINSSDSAVGAVQFGQVGDIPVPADYTGDGRDELAVYRNGEWWTMDLSDGQVRVVRFGNSTDKPVPADYDGDGKADFAVFRPSDGSWWIDRSGAGLTVKQFGIATDRPVVGDYDGDGKADLAVYRDGTWYVNYSAYGPNAIQWGLPTDIPVPGDYDGDGRADFAVYRDGTWYIYRSSDGGVDYQVFGLSSDKPIPSAFGR